MKAVYKKYILQFKRPSGTSRGVLHEKETYIIEIQADERKGVGECALFKGLSADDVPEYEDKLKWLCENIALDSELLRNELEIFPSIWIGYEQAILNLKHGKNIYFPSLFTKGEDSILTNGLIWMGDESFIQTQINEKLDSGFRCIKLKIGVNWPSELQILKNLRRNFPVDVIELRVDANGAFTFDEAQDVLNELSKLEIHSIEQPIKAGQFEKMNNLCKKTSVDIALDEELIGIYGYQDKEILLQQIMPQYIILKPSLIGGFSGTDEWIELAEKYGIGWWITSALESNIGLNAIAQYTYQKKNKMPQGLGTGGLFVNNFTANLVMKSVRLWFKTGENS